MTFWRRILRGEQQSEAGRAKRRKTEKDGLDDNVEEEDLTPVVFEGLDGSDNGVDVICWDIRTRLPPFTGDWKEFWKKDPRVSYPVRESLDTAFLRMDPVNVNVKVRRAEGRQRVLCAASGSSHASPAPAGDLHVGQGGGALALGCRRFGPGQWALSHSSTAWTSTNEEEYHISGNQGGPTFLEVALEVALGWPWRWGWPEAERQGERRLPECRCSSLWSSWWWTRWPG